MLDTWLTPGGVLDRVMGACRIPEVDRLKPDVIANVELAASVACSVVEDGWAEQGDQFRGVGPIEPTPVTARYSTGGSLVLEFPPLSLTAFTTDSGSVVDVATLQVAGQVVSAPTLPAGTLTYRAGYDTPPAWAVGAGLIIAEHYYRTRLGSTRVDSTPGAGAGFIVPNAARALLAPHERTPLGFA